MAADVEIIRRYCTVDSDEERLLGRATAPIVLLNADGPKRLPEEIAPGLGALGFMLPTTPLHALMLRRLDRPNRVEEAALGSCCRGRQKLNLT